MPLLARGRAALRERVRTRFARRVVVREVAGATLAMPWSHKLPDYTRAFPTYGRNLVDLAAELARDTHGPLQVVDLGANIGDSALQILARVDARVLCIDGDPHWLPFLQRNAGGDPRVEIEPALLVLEPSTAGFSAVRTAGTTRFVSTATPDSARQRTVAEVRAAHPAFDAVRLIKSDTDGHDCRLVPALARAWSAADPVLFFEYDPELTRRAGNARAADVFDELASLGYTQMAAWDNLGNPLGQGTPAQLAEIAAAVFAEPETTRGYAYWDVAAGRDDAAGAALTRLVPAPIAR